MGLFVCGLPELAKPVILNAAKIGIERQKRLILFIKK